MITGYSIELRNNEEVLMLYINYDQEFGLDFNFKHKYSNMRNEINKFLSSRKIKFDGDKIVLAFGGIVLGVLLITSSPKTVLEDNYVYVGNDIIPYTEVIIPKVENNLEEIIEQEKQEVEVVDQKQDTSTNSSSNTTSKGNNSNNTSGGTSNSSSNNGNNNPTESKPSTPKEQMVTIYRTNGVVLTISLEEYLIGVVGSEMPASFNIEALKAQAVVARTYALKKIQNNQRLTDSVSTQSYKDNNQLSSQWGSSYNTYYQKVKNAVDSTKGVTVKYNGDYIDAVYHSTSNGKTEDAVNVWGNSVDYLKSVDSSWDLSASSYLRVVDKDFINILGLLGIDINDDKEIEVISRNSSGRISLVKIGNKSYTGVEFRSLLGLRSADFDISIDSGNFKITTRGYGHGVGMSQYGANGMASNGYGYKQILNHYYQGVSIN